MAVFHDEELIFIHVPKTGGSTIFKVLREEFPSFDVYGKIQPKMPEKYRELRKCKTVERDNLRVTLLQHATYSQIKSIIGNRKYNRYFKFAMVRNPWDRVVSFYEYYKQTGERGNTKGKTFKEWVLTENFTPHQYPYFVNKNDQIVVDFLLRFENFSNDFEVLCNKIGVTPKSLPHEKKMKRQHYSNYYDDETKERVDQVLKKDIQLFEYKFERQ